MWWTTARATLPLPPPLLRNKSRRLPLLFSPERYVPFGLFHGSCRNCYRFRIDKSPAAVHNKRAMKHSLLCLALFAAVAAWSLPPVYADSSAKMTKEEKKAAKEAKKEEKKAAKEAKKIDRDAKKAEAEGNKEVKAAEKEEADAKKAEKKAVAKALKKMKLQNGKPSSTAQYYFFYHTNSALAMSEENLDVLVEQSKAMKKAKIAIIVISHDKDDTNAVKFLKDHKANFPMIPGSDKDLSDIPGYIANGSAPHVTIVDNTGKQLADGDGDLVENWKDYTINADKDDDKDEA